MKRSSAMPKRHRENKKAKSKWHGIVFTRAIFVFRTQLARGIPLGARLCARHSARCAALRAAFRSVRGSRGIALDARLARGIPLDARLCAPSVFRTYPRTKNTSAAGASRGKSGRGRTRFLCRTARGSLPFRSKRGRAPRLSDLRSLCRP